MPLSTFIKPPFMVVLFKLRRITRICHSFCMTTLQHCLCFWFITCFFCVYSGLASLTITVSVLSYVSKRLKRTVNIVRIVRSTFSFMQSVENACWVVRLFGSFQVFDSRFVWNDDNSVITWGQLTFRFCYCSCLFVVLSIHNQTICLQQNLLLCIPIWNVYINLLKSK